VGRALQRDRAAVRNERTHAFGVPLRTRKFRRQVRIGVITHAYGTSWAKATTRCGIPYTHKASLVGHRTMLATRTSRDVDCMACLVGGASR
jgi:hypothetical protein